MTADMARTRSAPPSDRLLAARPERSDMTEAVRTALTAVTTSWWSVPLAIYLSTRLTAAIMIVVAAHDQTVVLASIPEYHSSAPTGPDPGYAQVVTGWDAQWYWEIATSGYPNSAVDAGGHPIQTALAFFPLYPLLVAGLMHATGLGFAIVAPSLSLVLGAAAVLVVHRLVERSLGRGQAVAVILLLCTFAAAPVLQTAYTESLALLLVATTLLLLARRQYVWVLLPIVMLGLTRNVAPALAPVVVAHWAVLSRQARMGCGARLPHRRLALVLVATVVAAAEWPLLSWVITGSRSAYLTTMNAWSIKDANPFQSPWLTACWQAGGWALIGLAVLVFGGFTTLMLRSSALAWGCELWAWGVSYPLYLLAVAGASTSIVRYLFLAFPLALLWVPPPHGAKAQRKQKACLALLALMGLGLQWWWIRELLVFTAGAGDNWTFP